MDIISRIKFFLAEYQIANSQFADKCDIPRPTVSQLLNGRNKKVSDEVISKIHAAYPNLSIMWLLFGEEPMLLAPMETSETHSTDSKQLQYADKDADNGNPFISGDNNFLPPKEENNRIVFGTDISDADNDGNNELANNIDFSRTLESFVRNAHAREKTIDNAVTDDNNKRIVNVIVFYSDNSFESFVPSR